MKTLKQLRRRRAAEKVRWKQTQQTNAFKQPWHPLFFKAVKIHLMEARR